MSNHSAEYHRIQKLLGRADIKLDGSHPFDITVNNESAALNAILKGSTVALGESYMRGDWDCERLDELIYRINRANLAEAVLKDGKLIALSVKARIRSFGSARKAFTIAERHYDIGNDLYTAMLDPRLVYTCGYWKDAKNLAQAQEAKLDLVCRKLGLKKGQTVLDIGGGWGSFAKFAAKNYGAKVTNITVSKEQIKLADELCKGLTVKNRLLDYRDLKDEQFDHVVSLGMFEHVNIKYYREFMQIARHALKDDGVFLLHTIGRHAGKGNNDWINKYIFPNSMLPSLPEITAAAEGNFIIEDVQNMGADYDPTLMAWWRNFEQAWPQLKENYSETFYRMWRMYLLTCAGSFRGRNLDLYQLVLTKRGVPGGYRAPR